MKSRCIWSKPFPFIMSLFSWLLMSGWRHTSPVLPQLLLNIAWWFQQYGLLLKEVFILKECNSEGFLEGLWLFKNQTGHMLFISVMVCLDFWIVSFATLLPYSMSFFRSSLFFTDLFLCILPNTGPCSFSLIQSDNGADFLDLCSFYSRNRKDSLSLCLIHSVFNQKHCEGE